MTQLGLPLVTPRDRGRLNALRSILAAVSEELRRQAPVARGIVDFSVDELPRILRDNAPFTLYDSQGARRKQQSSPYDFELFDLVEGSRRPTDDVFPNLADLVANVDLGSLSSSLQNAELIGIDESQVDTPLPQSALSFLKSVAFRMYRLPDGSNDEAAGPILNEMRMQLREDEAFESENKLLGYIRNNFIAYVSSLTSLAFGRRPFVVLHGPLVRAIGGFSQITFDYETARDLFNIDVSDAGEFELPLTAAAATAGDDDTEFNLSLTPQQAIDGESNIRQFNRFCLEECGRQCEGCPSIPVKARPGQQLSNTMIRDRDYPGFCLYFWMLRSLFDLCRIANVTVTSVVEDVSAATEMTRLILPSLFSLDTARNEISRSVLRPALQQIGIPRYSSQPYSSELYRQVRDTIDQLRLSDSNIFSYVL